ncbi:MAG TPA: PAS domain S-box protein [Acidobacteriaceae bacterium]|nr:PAS domain S-box protein [Acidobacteriaceae bacterium]
MPRFNHSRTVTRAFMIALAFSLVGAIILSTYGSPPGESHPWIFWFAAFWTLAQALLVAIALSSFRSAQRERQGERQLQRVARLHRSILDSAGPMMIACDLSGRINLFNPSAERMLGFRTGEAVGKLTAAELFPDTEMARVGEQLAASMPTFRSHPEVPADVAPALLPYVRYVATFPASRVRGFEMRYRRRDGSTFPAMVYLSAVRSSAGTVEGLVTIAVDLSATRRAEHALRESEERYRDLFENSPEMIATLSPRGRYLYVNPAWQTLFGMDSSQFESLIGFESPFPPEIQAEAAALFHKALHGVAVDQHPLRLLNSSGETVEVEASLSCRREESGPVSVRCIFRDVTQQNRRERRLRIQLVVSQIIAETTSIDEGLTRVLEALCTTFTCEFAALWNVDDIQHSIRPRATWFAKGRSSDDLRHETESLVLSRGQGLPGIVWSLGKSCWIPDLRQHPAFLRRTAARLDGYVSGWAVPVRVGNQVIAVVECFSRQFVREDPDLMTTVETVCGSVGQFMARAGQEVRVRQLDRQKAVILNSVADGIVGVDSTNRIAFVNPAAARMLECNESELIGGRVHELLHPPIAGCDSSCLTRRAFQTAEGASGQDVYFRGNGRSFPVEFSLMPMIEEGESVGSVLSFRDISQRYALDHMKDEFISTVSHELRTPLTSIRGALGLLSAGLLGDVSEKATSLLRIAVANSDRLVRLINDILDLERMTSGRSPLAFRRLSLDDLVRQSIDTMQPVADAEEVYLSSDCNSVFIEADADRLLQVLTNLLSNAIKFSPPRSTVRIVAVRASDGVTVSVIDEGRGVPADKLESIFDRFQQVDASDSRQKGGTGLGLAICRTIVQQHGGRIWAEQNGPRGAIFRFFLPERASISTLAEEATQSQFEQKLG